MFNYVAVRLLGRFGTHINHKSMAHHKNDLFFLILFACTLGMQGGCLSRLSNNSNNLYHFPLLVTYNVAGYTVLTEAARGFKLTLTGMCECVYVYVFMCAYVYVCMYLYIYLYIYHIYIYTYICR